MDLVDTLLLDIIFFYYSVAYAVDVDDLDSPVVKVTDLDFRL